MNNELFNVTMFVVVVVALVAAFKWIPKFLRNCARESFLNKYGKFIGKKGFFDTTANTFLDENKKPVPELSDYYFHRIFGFDGLAPCILCENHSRFSSLDILPQEFTVDFEVKYVGKITVLYHREYGEITYPTKEFKTRPTTGSVINLHGCFKYDSLHNCWNFFWDEN